MKPFLRPFLCQDKQGKHGHLLLIERFLFALFLLFLPTQLGKHFWPDFSYVSGIRSDYLSPTLYFTDILVIVLLGIVLFCHLEALQWLRDLPANRDVRRFLLRRNDNKKFFKQSITQRRIVLFAKQNRLLVFALALILASLIGSTVFAKSIPLALFGDVKFLEMVCVGWYVGRRGLTLISFRTMTVLFGLSMLFESLLGIVQFFHQGSVGSLFYFFGERTFTASTPGIANASLGGSLTLRPYGSLPHPNVLAAYLLIGMVFTASQLLRQQTFFRQWFFRVVIVVSTIALLLTVSRTAILLFFLCLIGGGIVLLQKNHNKVGKRIVFALFAGVLVLFFFTSLEQRFQFLFQGDESVALRVMQLQAALALFVKHLLFGVGINNFLLAVPKMSQNSSYSLFSLLQPVHNIYFLIGCELGGLGLVGSLLFLATRVSGQIGRIRRIEKMGEKKSFSVASFVALLLVLLLGITDHYFWTLQQGRLLLAVVMGLVSSTKKSLR